MKKPMELADQLVREHADRIADTVTRIKHVHLCAQFDVMIDGCCATVVRMAPVGPYVVIAVVDGEEAWGVPENDDQRRFNQRVVDYCYAHDAEIRLAIDAALFRDAITGHGDGTNEDSLDADWKDGGA